MGLMRFFLYVLAAGVFLPLPCLQAQTTNSCFEIESILVDACAPEMPTREGLNEMVRFLVGPNSLNTSDLSVTWATTGNAWQGVCRNATTATKVAQLNATIQACGQILEPPNGILPPNSKVILVTSADMDVPFNSFAGLQETIYMIFQCGAETVGHFANYNLNPGIRNLSMRFQTGCNDQVSYDRTKLIDQDGNVGAGPPGVNLGDGATVNFAFNGAATYTNNGCIAPINPLSAEWDVPPPVCAGSGAFDLNNFLTGTAGGTWSGQGVSGSSFNPLGLSGSISITYKVGPANCSVEKTQAISVLPSATATWTNPGPLCSNASPVNLSNYITGTAGGSWSGNGVTGSQFNPSGLNGSVDVTYSVGSGACAATLTLQILVTPTLSAAWTNPGPLCDNAASVNLNELVTGSPGGTWSGQGVSGSTFNPGGLNGSIAITYLVGSGSCGGTLTHQVQVTRLPDASWNAPANVCATSGSVNLANLVTGTQGGTWSGLGISGSTFNPSGLNGDISITYTVGTAPCQASSMQVIAVSASGNAGWNSPGSICENASALNLNNLITGNQGGTWSGPGVNGNTFTPSGLGGNVAITYTSGSGTCQASSTQNITVNPVPAAPGPLTGRTSYCNEAPEPLQLQPETGATIEWYRDQALTDLAGSGNSFTPQAGLSTTYYAIQVKSGCRSAVFPVSVQFVVPPAIPLVQDTVRYCQGENVPSITATGAGTIIWYSDAALQNEIFRGNTYTPSGSNQEVFYVIATSVSCSSEPAIVRLMLEMPIDVQIDPAGPVTLCRNELITLRSDRPSGNIWSTGSTASSIQITQAGMYHVRVEGFCNTASDSVQVNDGSAFAGFSLSPPSGEPPLDIQVTETSINATGRTWLLDGIPVNLDETNQILRFEVEGEYRLTLIVTNGAGCTDSTSRLIRIFSDFVSLYVPNTFSPNGDSNNDYFRIYATGLTDLTVFIFNRWGEEIYRYKGVEGYWDGTMLNAEVEEGMYAYRIQARDILDRGINRMGRVLLIK
jgi:gliding motility-associated-like protein